uniref:Uncharacterized protein n=1 Tax=Zea mays TaxID=4577 RepID=A0A804PTF7_MAIZE
MSPRIVAPPPFSPPEGRHAPEGREHAREAVPWRLRSRSAASEGSDGGSVPARPAFLRSRLLTRPSCPQLGSAWARHGTILAGPSGTVLVLIELATLSYTPSGSAKWMKHPLSLSSKPWSPILASDAIFALCDVGTPWRSQWKLFSYLLAMLTGG